MSRVPVSGTLDTWPRARIVELFDGVADARLVVRFADYHALNADVYGDFVARAHQARKTGRRRYSQWTIIQSIRWDRDMRTRGDVFKVNNDFIALYVRMAIADEPRFDGFFELRAMKPYGRKQSHEEIERGG